MIFNKITQKAAVGITLAAAHFSELTRSTAEAAILPFSDKLQLGNQSIVDGNISVRTRRTSASVYLLSMHPLTLTEPTLLTGIDFAGTIRRIPNPEVEVPSATAEIYILPRVQNVGPPNTGLLNPNFFVATGQINFSLLQTGYGTTIPYANLPAHSISIFGGSVANGGIPLAAGDYYYIIAPAAQDFIFISESDAPYLYHQGPTVLNEISWQLQNFNFTQFFGNPYQSTALAALRPHGTVIPEPGTALLGGAGLMIAAASRPRRRTA